MAEQATLKIKIWTVESGEDLPEEVETIFATCAQQARTMLNSGCVAGELWPGDGMRGWWSIQNDVKGGER